MISPRLAARTATRTPTAHRCLPLVALLAAILLASTLASAASAEPKVETDDQKTVYLIGVLMAKQLALLHLSDDEMAIVRRAIKDTHKGKEMEIDPEVFGPKLRIFQEERAKVGFEIEAKQSAAYLAEQRTVPGAVVTDTGLIYVEVSAGTGAQPTPASKVRVTYEGKLRDGTVFDARTAEFPLDGVIKCWGEGVSKIKVGGKAKLVCPSEIAYGARGMPPVIPPGAALTFDIELLEILSSPTE